MTLADLKRGTSGVVRLVNGPDDGAMDDVSIRLLEMGLTPGCQVQYVGAAPLGDPLEFEVRGYRLSLRKAEAARVELDEQELANHK